MYHISSKDHGLSRSIKLLLDFLDLGPPFRMKFTIFANFGPKFRSLRSIEVNALKIIDQNIRKGINIIALVHQCDVTCSSWTLSRHFIQNFLYFSHFGAKSKAYKARKISLPRKINWKVSACICVTSQA